MNNTSRQTALEEMEQETHRKLAHALELVCDSCSLTVAACNLEQKDCPIVEAIRAAMEAERQFGHTAGMVETMADFSAAVKNLEEEYC